MGFGGDSVSDLQIMWDVLFSGEGVTTKGTDKDIAKEMDEVSSPHKIDSVLRWNTVLKGQKVAASGFTSGLRYMISIDHLDSEEISHLLKKLESFTHPFAELITCHITESLEFPLTRRAKLRFPSLGRIALVSRFTHGLGYTELTQIKAALNNQTKDTKNGLDPIRLGKGSSGGLFSEEFRSMMGDSHWFLLLSTMTDEGYQSPLKTLSSGSDGGMYELSFDLRKAISTLVEESKGKWWQPLDPDELVLNPQMIFDPSEDLATEFDPTHFHHHNSSNQTLIEKMIETEMAQTGDEMVADDLQYIAERLIKRKRLLRQITGNEHGLVSGLESGILQAQVFKPWIAEEFINCLAFFLITRKPKYWRNGKSEILLIHKADEIDIDVLKNE
jgi:hypothetical protein